MAMNDSIPPAAAAPAAPAARPTAAHAANPGQWAGLAALGVVFGDLGTSPLYTLQTVVQAMGGRFTPDVRSACCR